MSPATCASTNAASAKRRLRSAADRLSPPPSACHYGLIFILAVAMGIHTGTARRLAIPDLKTTTFTQLLTATVMEWP